MNPYKRISMSTFLTITCLFEFVLEPKFSDFSVIIAEVSDHKEKCSRKTADKRKIVCEAVGSAAVELHRLIDGTSRLVTGNITNKSSQTGGHSVQTLTYYIKDANKKDEGLYACYLYTKFHIIESHKLHLIVDGEYFDICPPYKVNSLLLEINQDLLYDLFCDRFLLTSISVCVCCGQGRRGGRPKGQIASGTDS